MDRITVDYPGHRYSIECLGGGGSPVDIRFIKKAPLHDPMPGILIQDLLRVCIHRVKCLDTEVQAPENQQVLYHLRMAILYQETRALRRKLELGKITTIEDASTGPDGHLVIG